MNTDVEAAYAAGILDGEGSIALTRNRKGRWPSPQVSVASNDRELLEWLRERFNGSISKKTPRQPSHSVSYDWKLTERRALRFLQAVRPYLIIHRKIERAEVLLEAYLACTPRNGRYSSEVLQRKQRLIELFASLP
jgi:LAGLIDADG-like domain